MKHFISIVLLCAAVASHAPLSAFQSGATAADNYVIGAKDVIVIAVYDQPSLGGKFTIDADGSFSFPHLGPVKAAGLTVKALEDSLRKRLGETLFRNPQISVGVEAFRSKRIFMMGEVQSSGQQSLTGSMTIIEALAAAGGQRPSSSGEAIIVRPREANVNGPVSLGDANSEVILVDLIKLQAGDLSQNKMLRDGDSVFVLRAESVYVTGQVRNPGAFAIQKQTTVLQAISLAGGQTENAAMNRIQIVRFENGKRIDIKVKNPITEIVKPGDTIMVPERWF